MSRKRFILFIFCCIYPILGRTQQLEFTNVSSNLGLPVLECYKVFQDRKGYIWISTEVGICRYNGTKLELMSDEKMTPNETVYALDESSDGTLWMVTSLNRIIYFKNNQLREAFFSDSYKKIINRQLSIPNILRVSTSGDLYINAKFKTVKINEKNHTIKWLNMNHLKADYVFMKTEVGLMSIDNDRPAIKDKLIRIVIVDGNKHHLITIPFSYNQNFMPHWQVFGTTIGKTHFFSIHNNLIRINEDFSYEITPFSERILSVYSDKTDGLWIGTYKGGIFYFPDTKDMKKVTKSLSTYSITGFCEDHENNIWVTTLEKGVFFSKNKNIINYSNIKGLDVSASLLKYDNGLTFMASESNRLFTLTPYSVRSHELKLDGNYVFCDILNYNSGWLIASREGLIDVNSHFNLQRYIINKTYPFSGMTTVLKKSLSGRIYGAYYTTYKEIYTEKYKTYRKSTVDINVRTMLPLNNGKLLLGSDHGLYQVDNPFLSTPVKIIGIDAPITQLISIDNVVWITTKHGLWTLKDGILTKINDKLKIPTDLFFDIVEDNNGTIWVASNIGLVKIIKQHNIYEARVFTTSHGLISSSVNKLTIENNNIYISTDEGICTFPTNQELLNQSPPFIYLNEIKINGRTVQYKNNDLIFPYNENSVEITLDVLAFRDQGKKLYYKFKNWEKDSFVISESNKINLIQLSPGTYELEIYGANSDGKKSDDALNISFTIQKPFWFSFWFVSICFILIGLAVYVIFLIYVKRIKRREVKKTEINQLIAESKLSALQAQMNPHFIFNAINSIQNYILKNNEQKAYDYLAKFAQLIRIVLNNSRQRTLSLGQEIETIHLYIELERLRFKNSFKFILEIDDEVNLDEIEVPAMLIQPYIENAIWHGLMPSKNKDEGKLKLRIVMEQERLKVTLLDNGIGRKQSFLIRKNDYHSPVAISLTEQRLEIINKLQGFEMTNVKITDLYDEKENSLGTQVEIWIPINTDL